MELQNTIIGKEKLLIVDDSEMNRAMLDEMFHDQYEILEAENGREAMKCLEAESGSIAVVLLDLIMPVMDGFETLKTMQRAKMLDELPVILVTADSSVESVQRGYELGAADVIVKPFVVNVVRKRVYNIIEQYAYRQNLETLLNQQAGRLRRQTDQIRIRAEKLQKSSNQMIDILGAIIEFKNMESAAHIHNIRILTSALLHYLVNTTSKYSLSEKSIETISIVSVLHDIGKIAIPDSVLNKPDRLTPEEFEVIKGHTVSGCQMLETLKETGEILDFNYCYDICRHHHERWDGCGYPDGLKGEEIPIWAQAVAIADVYDALTDKRVYRDAYPGSVAMEMILGGQCGVFNPALLECLKKLQPRLEQNENGYMYIAGAPKEDTSANKEDSERLLILLQDEQQRNAAIAEATGEITMTYNADEDKVVFSDQFEKIFGISATFYEASVKLPQCGAFIDSGAENMKRFQVLMEDKPSIVRTNVRMMTAAGLPQWFELVLRIQWSENEPFQMVEILGRLVNVSHLKGEADSWREKAVRDALTGLYNRDSFEHMVKEEYDSADCQSAGLFFLDLDNFKMVNDVLGHSYGDAILKRTASMLLSHIRAGDIVARWGGDEFIVWIKGNSDMEFLMETAKRLCSSLKMTEAAKPHEIKVSASIGIARYPEDAKEYETLVEYADLALQRVKRGKKGTAAFYNPCPNGQQHE